MTIVEQVRKSIMKERAIKKEAEREESSIKENQTDENRTQGSSAVSILRDSISLVNLLDNQEYELPHKFKEHTYRSPTHCEICSGLLVGLWSQGLQCEACGLNVHRGEGVGDHDDCHAEAMFTPCKGAKVELEEDKKTLGETIRELKQLAKEQPSFFADIRAQMDRDVKTHVKETVVTAGVEDEKSKKFLRAKAKIVPWLKSIDSIENSGKIFAFLRLMRFHALVALVAGATSFAGFSVATMLRHQGQLTEKSFHLVLVHVSTVLTAVHFGTIVVAFLVRHLTHLFKRKVILIDQFLREKLNVDAKVDLGVSVAGAARRAVWWSDRVVVSAAITCFAAITFWWALQTYVDPHEAMDQPTCKMENAVVQDMETGDLGTCADFLEES